MATETMLTTIDNPFNPFDDYFKWNEYDTTQGYHTAAFLGRISFVSEDLSEADYDLALDNAVDEIVKENILGLYVKVTRTVPE